MKNQYLSKISFIILFIALSIYCNGQSNAFKVNFLSPMVRTINASFERKLTPSSSSQIGFFYTTISLGDVQYKGYGITPEYRFYLSNSKEAMQGFYLAPFVRYQNFQLSLTNNTGKADFTAFGGGLVVGHQWVINKRITLDLFLGPKYLSRNIKVTSGSTTDFSIKGGLSGFGVRSGATIGIAF